MSTMNPLDPYGGTTPPIEQMLGNAYDVVRFVASNMDKVQEVNDNMEEIKEAATIKADILDLRDEAEAAKDASVAASAVATEQAEASATSAQTAEQQAHDAETHKTAAQASATQSGLSSAASAVYSNEAKAARDGAIAGANLYATEAAGRAAVADGATFNVQGSGDVAAYQYRRVDASTSVLIATFPSSAAVKKNTDAMSKEFYGAGYSEPLPIPAGTTASTGLILLDWPQKAGQITKMYLNSLAAGTVDIYVYSKAGDTFTLVRQTSVTISVGGYSVVPLDLKISDGEYIAIRGTGGAVTYMAARSDGNGWRSGTAGASFTQATVSTTTRMMIRFDITAYVGHDQSLPVIEDDLNRVIEQTLRVVSEQGINKLPPFSAATSNLSATATFMFATPAADAGNVVFECNANASGQVKIVFMTKVSDTRYEQRKVEIVNVVSGLNTINLASKAKKGDYFGIRGAAVTYRSGTSAGTTSFFTQNYADGLTWATNLDIHAGFRVRSNVAPGANNSRPASVNLPWEYMFIPSIGHSLIEGSRTGTNGQQAITTSQEYDNLAFPAYPNAPSSLAPATVASSERVSYTNRGEWSGLGAAAAIRSLLETQNNLKYTSVKSTLVVANNGFSGAKITEINKGTAQYNSLIAQAAALATVSNGTSGVLAIMLGIGENESDIAGYPTFLDTLVTDLDKDTRTATGQVKQVPTVLYQMSTQNRLVSLHQLSVARSNSLALLACPAYMLDYYDNIHIDSPSERVLGAYFAQAVKAVAIDGKKWEPLWPVACEVSGEYITLTFNKTGLVKDTTLVPAQANDGFSVVGNTISSVSVINGNQVRIQCATPPTVGTVVRYGVTAVGKGPYTGRAGNLRDNAGKYQMMGTTPLHNWCVEFDWTI